MSEGEWDLLQRVFRPKRTPLRRRERKGGRPPLPPRLCFDAVLWHLGSGLPWSCLPERFGSPRTIQRRLSQWLEQDSLGTSWRRYLEALPYEGFLSWKAILRPDPGKRRGLWYWEMLGVVRTLGGG
ncbi:MAG: transposase [Elusimicrobia bacterium]|nr:transposase [Elusimicrobiota bacterium]